MAKQKKQKKQPARAAKKRSTRTPSPIELAAKIDPTQEYFPPIATGSPVFVNWSPGMFKLGILVDEAANTNGDANVKVRVGAVDQKGRYTGEFGKPRTFERSEISRVYMERDWEAIGVVSSENAYQYDARIARGPSHDAMQRPTVDAAKQSPEPQGLAAGDLIMVKTMKGTAKVRVTSMDRHYVNFEAADGSTGSRRWDAEGGDWYRIDPRCLAPGQKGSKVTNCTQEAGHAGNHSDGSGFIWEPSGLSIEPIARVPQKYLAERGVKEKPIEVAPAPSDVAPAAKPARAPKPEDPAKAARRAERERKKIEKQGNRAVATAVNAEPNPTPIDQAVADAEKPKYIHDPSETQRQRDIKEAARLGIPVHRYVEQREAEQASQPVGDELERQRLANAHINAQMTGRPVEEVWQAHVNAEPPPTRSQVVDQAVDTAYERAKEQREARTAAMRKPDDGDSNLVVDVGGTAMFVDRGPDLSDPW